MYCDKQTIHVQQVNVIKNCREVGSNQPDPSFQRTIKTCLLASEIKTLFLVSSQAQGF